MKIIGLTGGIGTGKSTVAKILAAHNAYIIDADKLNHDILKYNKEAYDEIVDCFSTDVLDAEGHIDRKKLGHIVFNDAKRLQILSDITHKYVIQETRRRVQQLQEGDYAYVVFDAPLLIEAGMHKETDEVWIVYAEKQLRIDRVMKRNGLSAAEVERIMERQTPFEELRPYADHVILNNDGYEQLEVVVKALLIAVS